MLDKFTERARQAMMYARSEAQRFNHSYIGTEHILLGLLKLGNGIAIESLRQLGYTIDDVRKEVEVLLKNINSNKDTSVMSPPNEELNYTPRAKHVLEMSFKIAQKLGHGYIGTEHLLLSLLEEGQGIAAKALIDLGIELAELYKKVMQILGAENSAGMGNSGQNPFMGFPGFGGQQSKTKKKYTDSFSKNFTQLAKQNKLDPVIGRQKEIDRIIQILSRRTKNNPVLIGEPGVGKTAIIEGLAQKIVAGEIPEFLADKKIIALDMAAIVAGTKYRGEFEMRIKKIIDEAVKSKNTILFIDEMHTIIGAGGAEGSLDAANILKDPLARGELQCIGATTLDDYRKYVEKDTAIERRFQTVVIEEPSIKETIDIIQGLRDKYEAHHKLTISDESIVAAVKLSARYITDRFLPDKAVDLIDEAASKIRMKHTLRPPEIKEYEEELSKILEEKKTAVINQEFEKAALYKEKENEINKKLNNIKQSRKTESYATITSEDVADVIGLWTGIPVAKLTESENSKLLFLEDELHESVIGQNEAINAIARAVRRTRSGLKNPEKPVGTFLFLGPTGVGKTELAKTLAKVLFGNEEALVRIDMSEYMEKFNASRLIGSPPGYVGYNEGGQLTEAIRRKPYSVILLDEIEKAHPDIFNILLQVFDDGKLTDSLGHKIDFKNTIIIMTSNIGAKQITKGNSLGFSKMDEKQSFDDMKKMVMSEVKKLFRPEFVNRIDEIIVFHQLTKEELADIVEIQIADLKKRLQSKNLDLELTKEAQEFIIEKGFDKQYGARPLKRTIQKYIEDVLSFELLEGKFNNTKKIKVILGDEKLEFMSEI